MKPPTVAESGVGSAGECGLTEGTVETGATSEVAGHAARIGVQLKVLQEERVFLASGIIGCEESATNHFCSQGTEASERVRSERRLDILRTHPHHPREFWARRTLRWGSPTGIVPWTRARGIGGHGVPPADCDGRGGAPLAVG